MTDKDKDVFLLFLKGLLKDQPYVEFAYMTGVLPIAKYSSGSELNMFVEFNAINDDLYEDYFSLNEDEVRQLCDEHKSVSYEELKYWYDGYRLSDGGSLFNCLLSFPDNIQLLYRDYIYDRSSEYKNIEEIIVIKNMLGDLFMSELAYINGVFANLDEQPA